MKRLLLALVVLGIVGAAGFWILTIPQPIPSTEIAAAIASHPADLSNGELVFNTGGCVSCHAAKGAKDADRLKLLGGQALVTPFGTFHVPNISPDPATGIGRWQVADIVNAVMRGVSPDGRHYYPAFPYSSYARLTLDDAIDLAGYLETGFTPDGDVVGGAMAEVVQNMAKLPKSDREAIAAYLKVIPPHPPAPKPNGS